jgi:predicted secreted protein
MMKKLLCMPLLLLAGLLWAGDTAVFVDLGFSADGRTYMFAQYGVQTGSLKPWADLNVVDVPSNSFVSGGKISYIHDRAVQAGQDGSGALYRVIARNTALADRYGISFLLQGQPLYVALENGGDTFEFRDFERSASFRGTLTASYDSSGSSFSINIERTGSDGSTRSYTAGNRAIKRAGITSYRVRRVISSPRDGSLIFVIELKKQNADGSSDIRYMVETLKL